MEEQDGGHYVKDGTGRGRNREMPLESLVKIYY